MAKTKFIFVTGGVLSGLGKGVTAASIGNILRAQGLKVWMQKFDQYLNVDAGTLNPNEHGEVFVLDDGAETDLDLGHYERFVDINLNKTSSVMTGQLYQEVLNLERSGKYLGKTIQMIPHIVDAVRRRMFEAAENSGCDVLITEIGGTIGDYEGVHFVEAIRRMRYDAGRENILYVHVGFLPYLGASEELKTKPIQNSVHDLQAMGIQPDIVIARADHPVGKGLIDKIALYSSVETEDVIPLETVDSIYKVPQILKKYNLDKIIAKKLKMRLKESNNSGWDRFVKKIDKPKQKKVKIGLVGKYLGLKDTYFSVTESLKLASIHLETDLEVEWIDSEEIEQNPKKIAELMKGFNGILVPGGFGSRGVEGKILAIKFARENKIPYLGLCYGMQLATIEFARHVTHLKNANTTEIDKNTPYPVIHIMPEQEKLLEGANYGGTMRLGAYDCKLMKGTISEKAYRLQTTDNREKNAVDSRRSAISVVSERHRHRYEFNNKYREILTKKGLVIAGTSPNDKLVEIVELALSEHPFFVGTQFHPEFKSRPLRPHPLFLSFIESSLNKIGAPEGAPQKRKAKTTLG